MKIWAHRGCSQRYPENTMLAFEKAAELKGLTGIELDIQLTKDGEIVVIHDERVDRTTEGTGYVKDFTLSELKRLHIYADENPAQSIPTINEVLDLLQDRMKGGLKLNIELKNSVNPYEGMEEKIVELIGRYGLQENIVYSSFYALSLEKLREIEPQAEIGILDTKVSDCLYKVKGGSAQRPCILAGRELICHLNNYRDIRCGHGFPGICILRSRRGRSSIWMCWRSVELRMCF